MTNGDVTVCMPCLPARTQFFGEALDSVNAQTFPCELECSIDMAGQGAALMRDMCIEDARTELVACLDDDDWLEPYHVSTLRAVLLDTGADLVYPWFTVVGGTDPFPQHEGVPWSNEAPHQVPVTWLARRDVVMDVGGFSAWQDEGQVDANGDRIGEDMDLILRLVAADAKIVHLPMRTWFWRHHSGNTSGKPGRGDGVQRDVRSARD